MYIADNTGQTIQIVSTDGMGTTKQVDSGLNQVVTVEADEAGSYKLLTDLIMRFKPLLTFSKTN